MATGGDAATPETFDTMGFTFDAESR